MASSDHDISVLNGLIATTLDSAHGYQEAAKDAQNPRFKSLFEARAGERKKLTLDLQQHVVALGGTPEDDGTTLASMHRAFVNLKNSLTGSDQGVVDEVEAGEDHIKAKFEAALRDDDLSPAVKSSVAETYAVVKAGHDQMRDLKHELHARSAH